MRQFVLRVQAAAITKTPFVIRNDAEQELTGCTCVRDQERELEAIAEAIDAYCSNLRSH